MGLYEVPFSMSLFGFGMGTMLANFHIILCGIMLVLMAVFNMLVRNGSPRGPMCYWCLMFSLSEPPCSVCVSLLMDLFVLYVAGLTAFVK